MGTRRSNIIIVAVILVAAGRIDLRDRRRSRPSSASTSAAAPSSSTRAQPSAENPTVDSEDIDRAIEIIRDRVDALGVSEPEIAPLGTDQIQISLPNVQDAQRAIEQVGDTAKLYFYDLEPNVVPLDPKVDRGHAGEPPAAVDDEPLRRGRARLRSRTRSATTSARRPARSSTCSRRRAASTSPARSRASATSSRPTRRKAVPKDDQQDLRGPAGDDRRRGPENSDNPDAPPALLRPQDRPALSGDDIKNPEQNFDQNNQPNVTFDFTDEGRVAFQQITREIAQRGQESLGAAVRVRDRPRRRDRLAADHRLHREPGRDRRPHRRPDLGQLHHPGGPGPRDVPEDRRAAGRAEADQPEHGHRDARPAGARRRAQGGPDRPAARLDLLPPLLPLPRRDRDPRPRRLRDLLPRDHEADPDHADAAGHRRV